MNRAQPTATEQGPTSASSAVGEQHYALGESTQGRALTAVALGAGPNTTLIVGGFHGDECQSVAVANALIELLRAQPDLLAEARVVVMPNVNPDGAALGQRTNARRVDINRNFPAANWSRSPKRRRGKYYGGPDPASEPETRAVMDLIWRTRPRKIVAVHAIPGGKECNNVDGPAEHLAELMSEYNTYPVEPHIGYATPGSFGAWAGIDRQIPTVTLELPAERSAQSCWKSNRDALLAVIRADSAPAAKPPA